MRNSVINRKTAETEIAAELNLDGSGKASVQTGIGFLDHMLHLWTRHGFFDLKLEADGDLEVDGHHTVEDTGIVLGKAFSDALGDKAGIRRYGSSFVPMDETLAHVALDISGRPFLVLEVPPMAERIGDFDTELLEEFLRAFAFNAGITLHARVLYGKNSHHIVEALFKALGRALDEASSADSRIQGVMSTKGVL